PQILAALEFACLDLSAQHLKSVHGVHTHKLKGGVFPPAYELECYRALAAAFPNDQLRFDPNCTWSTKQGIQFARAIEGINNDYLEDPVWGVEWHAPNPGKDPRAVGHEHPGHGRGRHSPRHHVLGRYSSL